MIPPGNQNGEWTGDPPSWEQMDQDPDVRRGYGTSRIMCDAQIALGKVGSWKESQAVNDSFQDLMKLVEKPEFDRNAQDDAWRIVSKIQEIRTENRIKAELIGTMIEKLRSLEAKFEKTKVIARVSAESVADLIREMSRGH
jgi:hypothetical protein